MPFLVCRANVPMSREQETELKGLLGRAIRHVPGKSEAGLLVVVEGDVPMWLAGDDAPLAYVEVGVFANEGHAGYSAFVADVAEAFSDVLRIPPGRVYVRFADIPVWSAGDMLVDRSMFA